MVGSDGPSAPASLADGFRALLEERASRASSLTPWLEARRLHARILGGVARYGLPGRDGLGSPTALRRARLEERAVSLLRLPAREPVQPEPLPIESRPAPAPVPAPAPEPAAPREWPGDAAAQAEALRAASRDGVPFCAVCEAAKRSQWPGDAVAQAQTLREASEDGTPFCEECEAARRAGGEA